MTRLSKYLFLAAATLVAPVSTAFAQDDAPVEDGVEGGVEGEVGGEGTGETPAVEAPAADTGMSGMWSRSVIERPVTLNKGKFGVTADLYIAKASFTVLGMTTTATSEGLILGGGYGISDKLTVGGTYSFALNEFEIKGPLDIYGAFSLINDAKLTLGASADFEIDFAADNSLALNAGLGLRYKVAPKIALMTGTPWTPGVLGQHLHIGIDGDESKTFSLPVGAGFQATPELFAYVMTNIMTISLSDPGMGNSRVLSYGDVIPLSVGAFYSVTPNIDVTASLNFPDLGSAGDLFAITVGGRYYAN